MRLAAAPPAAARHPNALLRDLGDVVFYAGSRPRSRPVAMALAALEHTAIGVAEMIRSERRYPVRKTVHELVAHQAVALSLSGGDRPDADWVSAIAARIALASGPTEGRDTHRTREAYLVLIAAHAYAWRGIIERELWGDAS